MPADPPRPPKQTFVLRIPLIGALDHDNDHARCSCSGISTQHITPLSDSRRSQLVFLSLGIAIGGAHLFRSVLLIGVKAPPGFSGCLSRPVTTSGHHQYFGLDFWNNQFVKRDRSVARSSPHQSRHRWGFRYILDEPLCGNSSDFAELLLASVRPVIADFESAGRFRDEHNECREISCRNTTACDGLGWDVASDNVGPTENVYRIECYCR